MAEATPPAEGRPGLTRRELLNYGWLASLGILLVNMGGIGFLFSMPRFKEGEFGGTFTVGRMPDLPPVDASPSNNPKGKFWLAHSEQGVTALYKVCTHLGCLYAWRDQEGKFICPCHGIKGEGIQGLAPPLNDPHFFTGRLQETGWGGTLEDYIIATVSTGRPVSTRPDQYVGGGKPAMPAWSQQYGGPLREDQIRDIATFVLNWESTARGEVEIAELPTPTPAPEEHADPVARGQQVYSNSGCAGCHTIEGLSAGIVGSNLTQIGEVATTREEGYSAEDYIRESITNPNTYVVEGYQSGIMPQNYSQQLSQQELDDLVAFLLAQK